LLDLRQRIVILRNTEGFFSELTEGTVVDGEIVALGDSDAPNFKLCAQFRSETSRIQYLIFDLLICNNRDLIKLLLSERRDLMKSILKLRSPRIHIVEKSETAVNQVHVAVPQLPLEGFIAKCKDSLYDVGKRTGHRSNTG
jgi:bifunctional non-homologous end joining protein LigD